MKKLVLFCYVLVALSACGNGADKVDAVRFPPPVVAADEEVKGNATAEVRIDEPVGNSDVKAVMEEPSGGYSSAKSITQASPADKDTEKKIIKRGDISFEAGDIKKTRNGIINALKKAGGYVSQESETSNGEDGRKEYTLNTRIPAKAFDTFLSDVSNAAERIDSKNISMEDVTAQYIDITTRLQNKKALEQRYLALLKQANKMGDILEVENKLTEIRSDIESQQGQLNYLSKQVAYSSLDITFYAKSTDAVDKGYGAGYKFKNALGAGWDLLQGLFFGLIGLWPVIVIVAVLIWLFKRWRRKKRLAKAEQA